MEITEGLNIIKQGWVRKPTGFRVKYYRQTESGIQKGLSPPAEAAPLNSDVTAWRYAWKLAEACRQDVEAGMSGALFNITVVDEEERPVRFYGSGDYETYNPKEMDNDAQTGT